MLALVVAEGSRKAKLWGNQTVQSPEKAEIESKSESSWGRGDKKNVTCSLRSKSGFM